LDAPKAKIIVTPAMAQNIFTAGACIFDVFD
jgi:hypothetical protein